MALTTYTELKTSIADWLNRSDLTNQIDDFIGLAEADFNAKLRIRQMEQNDDVTLNAELVTVPTGFIAVRSFHILSASTKYFRCNMIFALIIKFIDLAIINVEIYILKLTKSYTDLRKFLPNSYGKC